jgi:hypothetical protein
MRSMRQVLVLRVSAPPDETADALLTAENGVPDVNVRVVDLTASPSAADYARIVEAVFEADCVQVF